MTRPGACAPRCLVARTLGCERLEDRWLLSAFSAPSISQWVGLATAASPVSALVSRASLTTSGDALSPDGFFVNRPPLPNSFGSPFTVGTLARSSGSIEAVETSTSVADLGIASVAPQPVYGPTMPFAVVVMNPGGSPADAPDNGGRIVADATVSSVFESNLSVGAVALPAPPTLSSQIGIATIARATGSGQTSIAFSVLGDGEVLLANISISIFGNVRSTVATGFSPGDLPTPESPAPSGVGTSATFLLAPLATEPQVGCAKIATNSVSSPGAAANSNNLSPLVGISSMALAPAVTNKVSASATRLAAVDRTPSLAGSWLAEVFAYRDLSESGNQVTVATTEPAPSPQRFELMTDFMPFDQNAVGQTIDQFLQRLDGLAQGCRGSRGRRTWLSNCYPWPLS